jgi:protein-disulfide isomerase
MIQKSRWALLVLIPLLTLTTLTAHAEDMTKANIERIVRDYLIANPEVIVEALTVMRQREKAAEAAANSKKLSNLRDKLEQAKPDPIGGNPEGTITLVEFFDYNCGYCKRANATLKALIEANPNMRVVYKEFPILTTTSMTAAEASLALNELHPEKYEVFHRQLLERKDGLKTDDDVWQAIAALDGVDVDAIKAESKKPWVRQTIADNHQLAQQLGITSTPTFVVGDSILPGAYPQVNIQAAIDKPLKAPIN